MPSRNSINRPKDKLYRASHNNSIGKKRVARARKAAPTRSSTSRYNTSSAPTPTESKAVALYNGGNPGTVLSSTSLSNKRAKKLSRNQKYINKRNEQLSIDVLAKQEEGMDIDETSRAEEEKKQKEQSQLDKVKQALWAVVEDASSASFKVNTGGEGTTLGVQAF